LGRRDFDWRDQFCDHCRKCPPERVAKLRTFWQEISVNPLLGWTDLWTKGDFARGLFNQMSAAMALFQGVANFFAPRHPAAWLHADGTPEATSFYDIKPLKSTLERLIDFDRINSGETRLSVGAVNARTGNFVYFDNTTHTIGPEHGERLASAWFPGGVD
jgi:NTE family protein